MRGTASPTAAEQADATCRSMAHYIQHLPFAELSIMVEQRQAWDMQVICSPPTARGSVHTAHIRAARQCGFWPEATLTASWDDSNRAEVPAEVGPLPVHRMAGYDTLFPIMPDGQSCWNIFHQLPDSFVSNTDIGCAAVKSDTICAGTCLTSTR